LVVFGRGRHPRLRSSVKIAAPRPAAPQLDLEANLWHFMS
jgi:hypothetical protein